MVARSFLVRHDDATFHVDYDTVDGLEVFKFQLFSLTSVPPDQQKIVGGDGGRVIAEDSDLVDAPTEVKLVIVNDEDQAEKAAADELARTDEELARLLQAEEEAMMLQQFVASEQTEPFEARIRSYVSQVLMYEDPVRQEAARKTVPIDELEEKALVSLAKEGNLKPSKAEQDHAFLLQLLFWFKQSFRWVNAPSCDNCGSETVGQGMGAPLASESQYGASRVELYRCSSCSTVTRFPRFNDPWKLLETRQGRCGEWANCFTLYCRAFGYDTRLIIDFTDHVWTECFSYALGRWMHLDPCEGVYDKPLLYEKGWNKKLNYVIAIAKDGVYDVTKRYTRKWLEVLTRRNVITEPALSAVLGKMTEDCRKNSTKELISKLEECDKEESEELERNLRSAVDESLSLPGRRSGDKVWRISRLEMDPNESCSLGSSSCPIRVCIDEHVTQVYDAFGHALTHFVENSLSIPRVVEVLKILEGILVDIRNLPFKRRKLTVNPFLLHLLPYFDKLLNALVLKSEIVEGKVCICLADDPVKTSLALPVAFDALAHFNSHLHACDSLDHASLSMQLVKYSRIHSGSVMASGEELPFGIMHRFASFRESATKLMCKHANFYPCLVKDKNLCWIIYKLQDDQKCELLAYDIVSANDAPERDPMDWIVEGSSDEGTSWQVLDRQTAQVFENRFERRSFTVGSQGFLCDAFRIRFLAVRDVQSTSRFQLGTIDFYTSRD